MRRSGVCRKEVKERGREAAAEVKERVKNEPKETDSPIPKVKSVFHKSPFL